MSTLFPSITPISADPRKTPFLFSKTSKLSPLPSQKKTHHHRVAPKISCNAANDEDEPAKTTSPMFDRRNVLIGGLGSGLYGAAYATLSGAPNALAAPLAPDMTKCFLKDYKGRGPTGTPCCPTQLIRNGDLKKFEPVHTKLRTRPSAHNLDPNSPYLAKFREAVFQMKNLPGTDPRSFKQQANVHCTYCDGGYHQVSDPKAPLPVPLDFKVHKSWLFLPFHRCYLYFFERILGKLVNDPDFAMPFWNWDHPQGMSMPWIYTQKELGVSPDYKDKDNEPLGVVNALYDELRDPRHIHASTVMDLKYLGNDQERESGNFNNILYDHMCLMKATMVNARDPESFMGGKYYGGQGMPNQKGTLERGPHDLIHRWSGSPNTEYGENMGVFYAAARDPLFYAHHGNVDRLWSIWKTLDGGKRDDFSEDDWLNTYFVFYDENAEPVKIYVKDCLDTESLGYIYEDINTPWNEESTYDMLLPTINIPQVPNLERVEKLPQWMNKGFRLTNVKRPRPQTTSSNEKKKKEEMLLVDLDQLGEKEFVKFDIYIDKYTGNKDDVSEKKDESEKKIEPKTTTLPCEAYAACFTNLPEASSDKEKFVRHRMRVPLEKVLKNILVENDEYVDVLFVPQCGGNIIHIFNADIKFVEVDSA